MKSAVWKAALISALTVSASTTAQTNVTDQKMTPSSASTSTSTPSSMPLSRAQVRADLARARTDGTIPRFGNPDPYGPAHLERNSPAMYPGR